MLAFLTVKTYFVFFCFGCLSAFGNPEKSHLERRRENPFRMNKMNLVWDKAKKTVSPSKHAELFIALKEQDKLELDAKRKTADGFDEDGEYAAVVRRKLQVVLNNFGIEKTAVPNEDDEIEPHIASLKLDRKLGKLWKKAKASGFNKFELANLRKELMHHQEKIKQFDLLKNEMDSLSDVSANSVHQRYKDGQDDHLEQKDKNKSLKTKFKELQEHYEKLDLLTSKKDSSVTSFTEPRALELWMLAQKANFSAPELASLKEELLHFEHKIKKQEYMQLQVANAYHNKSQEPKNAMQGYAYKVKKLQYALRSRIEDRIEL